MLRLSLPQGKTVWALAHPLSREYIHVQNGVGYQDRPLILTEADTVENPRIIDLDDYPAWARAQIRTSVERREILELTGAFEKDRNPPEKVQEVRVEAPEVKVEVVEEKSTASKPQARKKTRKKRSTRKTKE